MKIINYIINYGYNKRVNKFLFLGAFIIFSLYLMGTALADFEVGTLIDGNYTNNQCFICYDSGLCQGKVVMTGHQMYEKITINKSGTISSKNSISQKDIEDALEMGQTIRYSVYVDYIPPLSLTNIDGELIDSEYRGRMIFLGEEYFVREWNDDNKTLKLAKGKKLNPTNMGMVNFTTKSGKTYNFKIHNITFSEENKSFQIKEITINATKPDGTEIQLTANRNLKIVVEDIEICFLNAAIAGKFNVVDVIVYDLSTEIILNHGGVFINDNRWNVEISDVDLGCLAHISGDGVSSCKASSEIGWEVESKNNGVDSNSREKFKAYESADPVYGNEGMLQYVNLVLKIELESTHATETEKSNLKYIPANEQVGDDGEQVVENDNKNILMGSIFGFLIIGLILLMVVVAVFYFALLQKSRES